MVQREKLYSEILQFISDYDRFLVTTHMNADGDAYASILAVAYIMEVWNKEYTIIVHDEEKDEKYKFLWGWEKINSFSEEKPLRFKAAVVLDVPSKPRIGQPAQLLPARENCVKIDHHPEEEDFAFLNLVDAHASSTCQLVYEILTRSGIEFTWELATILFSGIMYDTGRFSFSNTSQRDFEIAAYLLQFGVKPHSVANQLFFSNSFLSMKTIGYGLANMESHLKGKLNIIFLPLKVMANNDHSEIEDLANYSMAIRGVEVGLFIREVKPNFFKVSFRSRGKVNVNHVARAFGGGGHAHAAGCRIEGNYKELKQAIIAEVRKQL